MSDDKLPLLENEQEPGLIVTNADENSGNNLMSNTMPYEQRMNEMEMRLTTNEQGLIQWLNELEMKLNVKIDEGRPVIARLQERIVQIQQQITSNPIVNWKYLLLLVILLVIIPFFIIGGLVFNLYSENSHKNDEMDNFKRQITNLTWEKNQLFNQLNGFELIWRENDPILETILDVKDLSIKVDVLLSGVNQYSSVMLAGGSNAAITDTVIVYNSNIKNWQNCQLKLPTTIASHGAVLLKNNIYILGGYVNEFQHSVSTVYKLETNNQWTNVANMSIKRSGISQSTIVYNSEIWVIGGWGSNLALKAVEKFNPETNAWQRMASMNYTRARAAATVINGKIYVSGGWDGNQPVNSVEVFDPVKNYWEIFKDLPHDKIWDKPLSSHTSLTDRTNLIIIGGEVADSSPTNAVWKINVSDPKAEWIRMASLAQGRYYHGAVKLKDQLMVIGGMESIKTKLNSVEMFDGTNWTAGPKLPIERTVFATIPLTKKYEEVILTKYKCFS